MECARDLLEVQLHKDRHLKVGVKGCSCGLIPAHTLSPDIFLSFQVSGFISYVKRSVLCFIFNEISFIHKKFLEIKQI